MYFKPENSGVIVKRTIENVHYSDQYNKRTNVKHQKGQSQEALGIHTVNKPQLPHKGFSFPSPPPTL